MQKFFLNLFSEFQQFLYFFFGYKTKSNKFFRWNFWNRIRFEGRKYSWSWIRPNWREEGCHSSDFCSLGSRYKFHSIRFIDFHLRFFKQARRMVLVASKHLATALNMWSTIVPSQLWANLFKYLLILKYILAFRYTHALARCMFTSFSRILV